MNINKRQKFFFASAVIIALAVVGCILCLHRPTAAKPIVQAGSTKTAPMDETQYEQQAVADINTARAEHGLQPLQIDARLTAFAYSRNHDMYARSYFGHHDPKDGSNILQFKRSKFVPGDIYSAEVEDGSYAKDAVDDWLKSTDGHREILLDPYLNSIGFAYTTNGQETYVYDTEYHNTQHIAGMATAELAQE